MANMNCINFKDPNNRRLANDFGEVKVTNIVNELFSGEVPDYDTFIKNKAVRDMLNIVPNATFKADTGKSFPAKISSLQKINLLKAISNFNNKKTGAVYKVFNLQQVGQADLFTWGVRKFEGEIDFDAKIERAKSRIVDASQSTSAVSTLERIKQTPVQTNISEKEIDENGNDETPPGGTQLSFFQLNITPDILENERKLFEESGITSNQVSDKGLINKLIYKSITPANYNKSRILKKAFLSLFVGRDYNDFISTIKKWREDDVKNDVEEENRVIPKWATEITPEQYHKREDSWLLSNGLPQLHNTFKYVGRGFMENGEIRYDINGEDIYDFNDFEFDESNIEKEFDRLKYGIDKQNAVMGKYAISVGRDSIGYFLKYTDRWDLDINNRLIKKVIDETQKPFIITGKIYKAGSFDEEGNFYQYYTKDSTDLGIQLYSEFMERLDSTLPIEQEAEKYEDKKASPELVSLAKEFLKKIGVDYQKVDSIVVDGIKYDANGVAIMLQKLVQVVEGKEAQTLPEEAMHFAVEIIEQTNPKLFKKLLSEVANMQTYKQVNKAYSTNRYYQKDGKPDIVKLKKEAIAKVLVDTLEDRINAEPVARTWWQQILDFLTSIFKRSGFDSLSMKILNGEYIGTADQIKATENDIFFNLDEQQRVFNKIKEVDARLESREDPTKLDEDGEPMQRYFDGDEKIPFRVTDFSKDIYKKAFGSNMFTEFQKEVNALKAEKGTLGHKHIEIAFDTFVDPTTGFLRDVFLNTDENYRDSLSQVDRDAYDILKENLRERLLDFQRRSDALGKVRFMSEVTIRDENVAGTIDFLAITPEGKVNILDWKFIDINTEKFDDVPWYKVAAWKDQLSRYKTILSKAYGIKLTDFEQTRAIPILAVYTPIDYKKNIIPSLIRIQIGDVDVKNIKQDYLLPVGIESETTGDELIDEILEKLNGVYEKLSAEKVSEEEKANKAEQLNSLYTAIRHLQIKKDITPLINQTYLLNKQVEHIINKYNEEIKDKAAGDLSHEEKNIFSKMFRVGVETLTPYLELRKFTYLLGEDESSQNVKSKLMEVLYAAQTNIDRLTALEKTFGKEYIGAYYNAEKVVQSLSKWFGNAATIQIQNLQTVLKLAGEAGTLSAFESSEQIEILSQIKEDYDEWAKSKGLNNSNYFDLVMKKDKNELIDQYQHDFYTKLKEAIAKQDFNWIAENVDRQAYANRIKEIVDEKKQKITNAIRVGTPEENQAQIRKELMRLKDDYDISTKTSYGWLRYNNLKMFPNNSWESQEWVDLHKPENAPAKKLYEYFIERNKEYEKSGYLQGNQVRTFLPYLERGLVEGMVLDGTAPNLIEVFLNKITISESETQYGKKDKVTGEYINEVPIYFTNKITGPYSKDLFKNFMLYNHFAIRHKNFMLIEEQARLLERAERNKQAISTTSIGELKLKNGKITYESNTANSKLFTDMKNSIIYNKKYIESEMFDIVLGKLSGFGKKINSALNMEIFPERLLERELSINKMLDQMNRQFTFNALGLNIGSSLSNLFGGSTNAIINSGKYFTKTEYMRNQYWVLTNRFKGKNHIDAKKAIAAIKYFMPFIENENLREINDFSLLKLDEERVQDFLMILMRSFDKGVQAVNFFSFFNNAIVIDGEIKNVREYLMSTDEYKEFYSGTLQERTARKEKFEKDIEALLEEKGLAKLSETDNEGHLVIPGVDRKSKTVIEFRRIVQQFTSDALGSLTEENRRLVNMSVYGSSLMLFHNWIPRLADVRMGDIKYNVAYDAYEWGRYRTVFGLITRDLLKSIKSLTTAISGDDTDWLNQVKELYEKKKVDYYNNTGKTLNMTYDEFVALTTQNVKNQAIEVVFLATLLALKFALKAIMPDDDEDPVVKNQYKYLLYVTDKFTDELSYFYDPTSIQTLLGKGIFPSLGMLNNYGKFIKHFALENYGLIVDDEKIVDDAKPIKYLMKSFPITSQVSFLLPTMYPELAKDLGIKMQSTYGMK